MNHIPNKEVEGMPVLSIYEGFFSGGARILHTEALLGLQADGQQNTVLSIHDRVYREQTLQPMENDSCYRKLRAAGIPVHTLGRKALNGPDMSPFSIQELDEFRELASGASVILSLKEQPLRLLNQAGQLGKSAIACLHRSDPENQGGALQELRDAVSTGAVDLCTISAESAKQAYIQAGIPADKLEVILNGIDLDRFAPSEPNRNNTRQQLGIGESDPVIMFVARYDFMKNIPLFLESAGKYLTTNRDGRVVMCGAGMTTENEELVARIVAHCGGDSAVIDRFHLLGIRRDMEVVYPAADIIASTSHVGETYPLCLLEGMACGAIPVATDVGDTRSMLEGGRGIITEFNADDIVTSWQTALDHRDKFVLSAEARRRLGHDDMVAAYASTIRRVAVEKRIVPNELTAQAI